MPPQWSHHKSDVDALIHAALEAADPAQAVRRNLRLEGDTLRAGDQTVRLARDARIFLVGAGKAGVAMALAAADLLGERLAAGVMAVPEWQIADSRWQIADGGSQIANRRRSHSHGYRPSASGYQPVEFVAAGHPQPNEGSLLAGVKIRDLLQEATDRDCVLALISGGGSALLELPAQGLTLDDLQTVTAALLKSGAAINDLNTVRKHLSQIKGGGLAHMAGPARVVALILSDVVGDPLDVIASGPTVPNPTCPNDALEILRQYQLVDSLPPAVIDHLKSKAIGHRPSARPPPPSATVVGSNRLAAEAAMERAQGLGFSAQVLTTYLEGEAREVGKVVAGLAKGMRLHGQPLAPPAALILGGETTVTVRGQGRGGRNQELALAAAAALDGWERVLVASLATDGVDGPTAAAGAIATGETLHRARALGLSASTALAANDSHSFFAALGALLITGPTGTNVNDLTLVMAY